MFRVVLLGDSLAFGAGDETHRGIRGRLEDELVRSGFDSCDIVNLGVIGEITHELLARLEMPEVARQVTQADAVVLSIGGNDLFKTWRSRRRTLRHPIRSGLLLLDRIEKVVARIHAINPEAIVYYLSTYNPIALPGAAELFEKYLTQWDRSLADRFAANQRLRIIRLLDVVTRARLSRIDGVHPGAAAYREAARRIAQLVRPSYEAAATLRLTAETPRAKQDG
jgi:lysophospholipase L1-like esterase